jgi:hypothetical protein
MRPNDAMTESLEPAEDATCAFFTVVAATAIPSFWHSPLIRM